MIIDNPFNRKNIKDFLNIVSEDDLIDEVIIPLFSLNGYSVLRRNTHGPGEHGKDIIFSKNLRLFKDQEYIFVQAKAEKLTTGNVKSFSDQIVRSFKVPYHGKAKLEILPNYVAFINSKTHTNDADIEFHRMVESHSHNLKILCQDQLVDLIIEFKIIPLRLNGILEMYVSTENASFNDAVRSIILEADNIKINKLLDFDLRVDSRPLSDDVKATIINYIFKKWQDNSTWQGTVKPMQWLNTYFSFLQPEQSKLLGLVFDEYTSNYPSHEARSNTTAVILKISSSQLLSFKSKFFKVLCNEMLRGSELTLLLLKKYDELEKSEELNEKYIKIGTICKEIDILTTNILYGEKNDLVKDKLRDQLKTRKRQLKEWIQNEE